MFGQVEVGKGKNKEEEEGNEEEEEEKEVGEAVKADKHMLELL